MNNQFNAKKLKEQLNLKGIKSTKIAKELNIQVGRVTETLLGIEHKEIIRKICTKYNLSVNEFYEGYIEPDYMKRVREKINNLNNTGLNMQQISKLTGVSANTIIFILKYDTYVCSKNIVNKILAENNKKENKFDVLSELKKLIGENAYNKLMNDANKNFDGNIGDTLKFVINKSYYN